MGKTAGMIEREKREREKRLRDIGDSGIEVWTPELMKMAGKDSKYVRTFESGTAGLKKIASNINDEISDEQKK